MKNYTFFIITVFLLLMNILPLEAAEKDNEDIDYIGVAAVLIRDGNYSRAERTLEKVDLSKEGVDIGRYYTLKGLVELRNGEYRLSIRSFDNAVRNGVNEPVLYAYIAQAHFALEEYPQTIAAIDKLSGINQFPDLYGMKSQAYWLSGDAGNAFEVIETGIDRFPGKMEFRQQKIFYLVELDLNQAAVEESLLYLELFDQEDPEAYLTIAEALRGGGEAGEAVTIMEMARLRFPGNQRIKLMLAQSYIDQAMPLSAGKIVEEASLYDDELIYDAAELFREAGDLDRAEYLNTLLTDQNEKTRLRFNILIEDERFEEALALESRLMRTGLLEDEGVIYALAYVCFKVQRYDAAVDYLNQITSHELFRQAAKLRQAIEIMRAEELVYF